MLANRCTKKSQSGWRCGVGVGGSALPGLPVGETVRRRLETEVSARVGEVGWSRQAGAVPPRPDLPVGDWTALLACCLDSWAGPWVARCLLGPSLCGEAGLRGTPGLWTRQEPSLKSEMHSKIRIFKIVLDGEMTKTKVVDLKKLCNFVADNFFIWIHLELQILISKSDEQVSYGWSG